MLGCLAVRYLKHMTVHGVENLDSSLAAFVCWGCVTFTSLGAHTQDVHVIAHLEVVSQCFNHVVLLV
jgi:hypothetical protein